MIFCTKCMKEVDYNVEEKESIEEVRDEHINAKLQITKCKECGSEIFVPEVERKNSEILYSEYRSRKGLLKPSEIKAIRDKYEISQTLFAKILGLGEKTIARYENGSIQEQAQNNLIMLCKNVSNFEKVFTKIKDTLTEDEIVKVKNSIDKIKELNGERLIVLHSYCIQDPQLYRFSSNMKNENKETIYKRADMKVG